MGSPMEHLRQPPLSLSKARRELQPSTTYWTSDPQTFRLMTVTLACEHNIGNSMKSSSEDLIPNKRFNFVARLFLP
jgi:hypothetical protein